MSERCPCGRTFGSIAALYQHQEAKGHSGMARSDFAHPDLPYRRADDPTVEDWHAMGVVLTAVAVRVKAGESINLDDEAECLGIPPQRLVRALRAHGAVISELT